MAERIQDYSEPVIGMHIKDIATIPIHVVGDYSLMCLKLLDIMSCDNIIIVLNLMQCMVSILKNVLVKVVSYIHCIRYHNENS